MTDITPELLLKAYAYGVFPMAKTRGDSDVFWVQPKLRGVIPLHDFHMPRSLRKRLRHGAFTVTVDTAFPEVIASCAEETSERADTWINDQIEGLFSSLFDAGLAKGAFLNDAQCVGKRPAAFDVAANDQQLAHIGLAAQALDQFVQMAGAGQPPRRYMCDRLKAGLAQPGGGKDKFAGVQARNRREINLRSRRQQRRQ